jgi:hypothetical protein
MISPPQLLTLSVSPVTRGAAWQKNAEEKKPSNPQRFIQQEKPATVLKRILQFQNEMSRIPNYVNQFLKQINK